MPVEHLYSGFVSPLSCAKQPLENHLHCTGAQAMSKSSLKHTSEHGWLAHQLRPRLCADKNAYFPVVLHPNGQVVITRRHVAPVSPYSKHSNIDIIQLIICKQVTIPWRLKPLLTNWLTIVGPILIP